MLSFCILSSKEWEMLKMWWDSAGFCWDSAGFRGILLGFCGILLGFRGILKILWDSKDSTRFWRFLWDSEDSGQGVRGFWGVANPSHFPLTIGMCENKIMLLHNISATLKDVWSTGLTYGLSAGNDYKAAHYSDGYIYIYIYMCWIRKS